MQKYSTIIGVIELRQSGVGYRTTKKRYNIGNSTVTCLLYTSISSTIPHTPRGSHSRGRYSSDSYFLTPFRRYKSALRSTVSWTG